MENILPGETGVVVPAGDAEALYQALVRLIADPKRLQGMGRAGRAYAESRTIEKAFEEFWRMYEAMPPVAVDDGVGPNMPAVMEPVSMRSAV